MPSSIDPVCFSLSLKVHAQAAFAHGFHTKYGNKSCEYKYSRYLVCAFLSSGMVSKFAFKAARKMNNQYWKYILDVSAFSSDIS